MCEGRLTHGNVYTDLREYTTLLKHVKILNYECYGQRRFKGISRESEIPYFTGGKVNTKLCVFLSINIFMLLYKSGSVFWCTTS